VLARHAQAILQRWGRLGSIGHSHVHQVIHGQRSSARHWSSQAIWEALVEARVVPEVPREVLADREALIRREPGTLKYAHEQIRLQRQLRAAGADKEVRAVPHLSRSVREHFGLKRDPFHNEIREREDYWWGKPLLRARDQLAEAIEEGPCFTRLAAPRGAGKTQIAEWVRGRAQQNGTLIVQPPSFLTGTLQPADVMTEIILALARWERGNGEVIVRASHIRRAHQMRYFLSAVRERDKRVVLWFEESHDLNARAFKALKRFWEEKDAGGDRLLSIVLIGQNPEQFGLEEVTKRLATIRIPPMHREIPNYIAHKIERAGGKVGRIFDDLALREIGTRCPYPLDANALCAELMIEAWKEGESRVKLAAVEAAEGPQAAGGEA
jgi:type II secretory pathway predicted ATPase ExeA